MCVLARAEGDGGEVNMKITVIRVEVNSHLKFITKVALQYRGWILIGRKGKKEKSENEALKGLES